ncbi:MAG: hypothetical protein IMW96_12660, partial [Thermoanaerobacteraceae bacterium]|nr:hypothetical protein [Thermoanaerobacteraceae bacterium]
MAKSCKVSLDPAPCEMVEKAGRLGVETLWDRYQAVLSQCGSTGCGAGALMRHGSMDPAQVGELCGDGLKAVLTA